MTNKFKEIGSSKDKTLLVCDNGLFFEFALKLSDYFKKVYYYVEWKEAYPRMTEAMIGCEFVNGTQLDTFDGKNIERVENMFSVLDQVDCFFTPDIYDGDLLEMFEAKGIPCFGAGKAEMLEMDRFRAAVEMKKAGMDVAKTVKVIGLDNLRKHLKINDNKFVKISKYRDVFETFKHDKYETTEPVLDRVQSDLGPLSKVAEFVVVDNIDADVEEGVDSYSVDGQLPKSMVTGCEIKDAAYAGKLVDTSELSEGNVAVNTKFSKLLKMYDHNGFFSTEVRTKGNKHYFIDPCMRLGLPPNAMYQEIYKNLGDIVWQGANGILIEPNSDTPYGIEVLMSSGWHDGGHQAIKFPNEYRSNIKLINPVKIDGEYYALRTSKTSTIGSIVATGNSLEECAQKVREIASKVEGYDLNIKTEGIEQAIEAFNTMKSLAKK